MLSYFLGALLVLSSGIGISSAFASDIKLNGFGSVYGTYGGMGEVLKEKVALHPDFKGNTRIGFNLSKELTEFAAVHAQFLASGATGIANHQWSNWDARADWFFVSVFLAKDLKLNVGRQIFPAWLVSQFVDVGAMYPWRLPPHQVYNLSPFKAFEGLLLNYKLNLGSESSLQADVFGGAQHNNMVFMLNEVMSQVTVDGDYVAGLSLTYQNPTLTLRGMFSRITYDGVVAAQMIGTAQDVNYEVPLAIMGTLSGKYENDQFYLYAEYGNQVGNSRTSVNVGGRTLQVGKGGSGFYGTLGYHLGAWTPLLSFAQATYVSGYIEGTQTTYGLGLNREFTPSLILKTSLELDRSTEGGVLLSGSGIARTVAAGLDILF